LIYRIENVVFSSSSLRKHYISTECLHKVTKIIDQSYNLEYIFVPLRIQTSLRTKYGLKITNVFKQKVIYNIDVYKQIKALSVQIVLYFIIHARKNNWFEYETTLLNVEYHY